MPTLVLGPITLLSKQRRRWLQWTFLGIGIATGLSFLTVGACFLTIWEKDLLMAAGLPVYTDGFVRHYLSFVGINWPDIWTTWLIRISVVTGVLRLAWLWWQDRKTK